MKLVKRILLSFFILGVLYLGFYPIPLDPIARKTPPFPGLKNDYKPNELLKSTQLVMVPHPGPESIVRDSLGNFYTGLANGDILQFDAEGNNQEIIANTGGRPLGMKIAPSGELIIADHRKGLLALDSLHKLRVLVDQYKGEKLLFVDDLDISNEGIVYFSNATQRNPDVVENEAWEQRASGALFAHDLLSGKTTLLKDDLFFPNGIALNESQDYFIFSETFGLSLSKYWLKGTKKNTIEVFNNELPGYPDNVTFSEGIFWVAIPSQRAVGFEPIFEQPFLRSMLLRLPEAVLNSVIPGRYSMLLGFDESGIPVYNLQDPDGKYDSITSVLQVDNQLYLGSLTEPSLGIYTLK
jgi:sugar lactone lactonase YvrE